jgi:hypothetical protein
MAEKKAAAWCHVIEPLKQSPVFKVAQSTG